MTSAQLVSGLTQTSEELLQTFRSFTRDNINTIPFEGSWTGGQLAEHLIKSEGGLPALLTEGVEQTKRAPDMHFNMIESVFLNFDTKLNAPEFIVPSDGPHDLEASVATLSSIRGQLIQLAGSLDLTLTCTGASFPQVGQLTRMEWLHFVECHSIRHTRQLKNILSHVQ